MFTLQGTVNQPIEKEFDGKLIDKDIFKAITLSKLTLSLGEELDLFYVQH